MRRDPRGGRRLDVPARRPRRSRALRARSGCRSATCCGSAASSTPNRATTSRELAATPRELPLVLVGPTRPWAHELPGRDPHGAGPRRAAGGDLQRRPRARDLLRAGGLRAAGRRGARLRHAGRRLRRARRCARCWASARRSSPAGDMPALIEAAAAGRPPGAARPAAGAGRTPPGRPGSVYARAPPSGGRPAARTRTRRAEAQRPRAASSSRSVGAAPRDHGGDRLQQDRQVERQRPALEVEEVEVDEVVEVELRAARDLPQPGDARAAPGSACGASPRASRSRARAAAAGRPATSRRAAR